MQWSGRSARPPGRRPRRPPRSQTAEQVGMDEARAPFRQRDRPRDAGGERALEVVDRRDQLARDAALAAALGVGGLARRALAEVLEVGSGALRELEVLVALALRRRSGRRGRRRPRSRRPSGQTPWRRRLRRRPGLTGSDRPVLVATPGPHRPPRRRRPPPRPRRRSWRRRRPSRRSRPRPARRPAGRSARRPCGTPPAGRRSWP